MPSILKWDGAHLPDEWNPSTEVDIVITAEAVERKNADKAYRASIQSLFGDDDDDDQNARHAAPVSQ